MSSLVPIFYVVWILIYYSHDIKNKLISTKHKFLQLEIDQECSKVL